VSLKLPSVHGGLLPFVAALLPFVVSPVEPRTGKAYLSLSLASSTGSLTLRIARSPFDSAQGELKKTPWRKRNGFIDPRPQANPAGTLEA
jgi:hypothetical protein